MVLSGESKSCSVGEHPVIKRFMKGIFNYRPALPRYNQVWDVSIVLKYLKSIQVCENLKLKLLTCKLVMLFALLSGQRAQSLWYLDINNMTLLQERMNGGL